MFDAVYSGKSFVPHENVILCDIKCTNVLSFIHTLRKVVYSIHWCHIEFFLLLTRTAKNCLAPKFLDWLQVRKKIFTPRGC
jgi:hypothetical protein